MLVIKHNLTKQLLFSEMTDLEPNHNGTLYSSITQMDCRFSLTTLFMINFIESAIVFLVVAFFYVLQSGSVHFISGFWKSSLAWRSLVCTQPQCPGRLWQHWIVVEEGYFGVMAVQGQWNNTAARACGGAAKAPFCDHRACRGPSGLQWLGCTSASHWSWTVSF